MTVSDSRFPRPSIPESPNPKGVRIAMLLFAAMASLLYAVWLLNPFPNEYREGASLYATHLMAQGINVFSDESPASFFYMYGFISPWITAVWQQLLGDHGFLLHRLLALAYLLAAAFIVEFEARRVSAGRFPPWMPFLLMLPAGWVNHELVSRPDNLALLLFVSAAALLARPQNRIAPAVAALCILLSFYTKQYYVLMTVPLFAGALFTRWQNALIFGFTFNLLFFPSLYLVNEVFPFYFPMTMLAFGESPLSWSHLARQIAGFGLFYWPLMLVVGLASLRALARRASRRHDVPVPGSSATGLDDSVAASCVPHDSVALYAVLLACNALLLLWLGTNKGAVLSYFYQLLLPPLIIVSAWALAPPAKYRTALLYGVCMFSMFHICGLYAFTRPLDADERRDWREATALIDSAGRGAKVESALFVPIALSNDLECFECGLFASEWLRKAYGVLREKQPVVAALFPSAPALIDRCVAYRGTCANKLEQGAFSLVVTDQYSTTREKQLIRLGYKKDRTITLRSGRQIWPVVFWTRDLESKAVTNDDGPS